MILKAKKGMWFTQAKEDVKFRVFLKFVPVSEEHKADWVEWSDKQRKEYYSNK